MFSADQGVTPTSVVAEAIDFDGTNDYLNRASDLTGNADGKTFTFSAWVWLSQGYQYLLTGKLNTANGRFDISTNSNRQISIIGRNSSGTVVLNVTVDYTPDLRNTFVNLLVSVDLSSISNRSIYFNDVLQSATWSTYTNANINFTYHNGWNVGADAQGGSKIFGRLSNVYLDYTYRDLSITANRRLFVTADLKPASGQAALNPILYLPMNDPTAPGTNAGTGGNFTLTGTVARSGRGPNQYNVPYSTFNGTTQYLNRTSNLTGAADSKTVTMAFNVYLTSFSKCTSFFINSTGGTVASIQFNGAAAKYLQITWYTAATGNALNVQVTGFQFALNRNYNVVFSVDMANAANRFIYINGQTYSATWSSYVNTSLGIIPAGVDYQIANSTNYSGNIGALWFNTSYIDLSVASNLAKFVTGTGIDAKPVDLGASGELPTGTSPLIYLPMYGNNAGKNYGTGGDFTVNSGPYTGARGPNEFWGNKADFDGTTGYLSRTSALTGVSDGGKISGSFYIRRDAAQDGFVLAIRGSGDGVQGLEIFVNNAGALSMYSRTSAPVTVLDLDIGSALPSIGVDYCVQFCFDFSNTSKRFVYVNGVQVTPTYNTYTNGNGYFSAPTVTVGARSFSGGYQTFLNGVLSELYFVTDYIDFSLESNRLKFRDAFGNPVDLTPQITANSIPNPAIYMRFPPTSFGTNSGTGGNFTVNGTITDGGQL